MDKSLLNNRSISASDNPNISSLNTLAPLLLDAKGLPSLDDRGSFSLNNRDSETPGDLDNAPTGDPERLLLLALSTAINLISRARESLSSHARPSSIVACKTAFSMSSSPMCS
jgi:hypothetical protein